MPSRHHPRFSCLAAEVSIDAPLVFVGYGISRPDLGYDDLADVDVHGAIALLCDGAPRRVGAKH